MKVIISDSSSLYGNNRVYTPDLVPYAPYLQTRNRKYYVLMVGVHVAAVTFFIGSRGSYHVGSAKQKYMRLSPSSSNGTT